MTPRLLRYILATTVLVGCSSDSKPNSPVERDRGATHSRRAFRQDPLIGRGSNLIVESIEFVKIPEGYFVIGSPDDEPGRSADEQQRFVTIYSPLYLATTETTQEQFARISGTNPSGVIGEQLPVSSVTWNEAAAFCDALSSRHPAYRFRLPTEEEWEYACRAGSKFPFGTPFGKEEELKEAFGKYVAGDEDFLSRFVARTAFFNEMGPQPAGSKLPNVWGLYDMHGNVWEWCVDDGLSGDLRPIRGGAWSSANLWGCRAAIRAEEGRSTRKDSIGFRIVAEEK